MTTLLDAAQDEARYIFRHRCVCGARFAVRVPPAAPVSCQKCNVVAFATPKPCDEHWWTWFVAQPLNRKMLHLPPLYVAETPTPNRSPAIGAVPKPSKAMTAVEERKERDERLAGL